ncbi:MAG: 4Fe-4S cluster-binding domain-containing protein [Leptospiraceae bacterium]|nr:4Fe-4S cluster-binding domain-containing protein [Leptospiraceae bacterium]MCP5493090.1 4Fe-4S cluster-binding domain-containing protein [Leptospiraceae bacterium]
MKAIVNEIFYSISGEGISTGIPTVFVRLAGCSLRCGLQQNKKLWCDTGYALNPNAGSLMSIYDVIEKIDDYAAVPAQILLTGGEPLEGEKREFCKQLAKTIYTKQSNKQFVLVRVETNGKEAIDDLEHMVFSMDYKLPGSGMEKYMNPENLQVIKSRKNPLDEIKFIVRDQSDFNRVLEVSKQYNLNTNLSISPVYNECKLDDLAEWILKADFPGLRLSIQLHKLIWGEKRGV